MTGEARAENACLRRFGRLAPREVGPAFGFSIFCGVALKRRIPKGSGFPFKRGFFAVFLI